MRTHHGQSDFRRLMELGVRAADGQIIVPTATVVRGDEKTTRRVEERKPLTVINPTLALMLDFYEAELAADTERLRKVRSAIRSNAVLQEVAPSLVSSGTLDEGINEIVADDDTVAASVGRIFNGAAEEVSAGETTSPTLISQRELDVLETLPIATRKRLIWHRLCCLHNFRHNNFGRLFAPIPDGEVLGDAALEALSLTMNEGVETSAGRDPNVPAGFIFFAQFVDHDITFDASSRLGSEFDPVEVVNLRTPELDLDSVYGQGPEGSPELYDETRAEPGEASIYLQVSALGVDLQ